MRRRFIISLLALVLFSVQQVSATVYTGNCGVIENKTPGNNVTWSLDTDTHVLTISGSGEMANWDTSIGGTNDYRTHEANIYTVVFAPGSSITSIGNYAFYACAQLQSITIPSTVTSFGTDSFRGCKSLTSISIPSSVTSIGANAFYGCEKLNDITFYNLSVSFSYDYNYFFYELPDTGTVHYTYGEDYTQSNFWKTSTKLHGWNWVPIPERLIIYTTTDGNALSLDSYTEFGANVIKDTVYIEEGKRCIAFDGNVTAIPENAFKGKGTLSSIILPETVTSIGSYAFQWDYNLSSINIPESVTRIDYSVFNGCSSLSSIMIPYGVKTINGYTFYGCSKLASIDIPASVDVIGEGVFEGCSSLESISIPTGVTEIYVETFRDCSSLSSITIPENVTSIGKSAFQGCSSLSSINIPEGVTVINDSTFKDCSTLPSINIPDSVKSIGNHAFKGCSKLSSIKIPEKVTTINDYTFSLCGELSSVDIPTGLTSIGSCAFQGCNKLSSIDIPEGVSSIGSNAFQWCNTLSTITIPSSMTTIHFSTFNGCTGLTSINIPSSVNQIDSYAFYCCSSLSQITIPSGVTAIYDHTFYGCSSLASITIPSSVTSIGESAFYDCTSLNGITINFEIDKTTLGTDVFGGSTPSTGGTVNYLCGEKYTESAWWTNSSNKLQGWTWERIIDPNRVIEYTTNSNYAISLSNSVQWSSFGANKSEDIVVDGKRRYIIFDGNVTTIPQSAFIDNGHLTSIILPPTVTKIEKQALCNCSCLTSVTLSRDLSSIAEDALHTYVNSNLSTNGPIAEIRVTSPNNPIWLNDNVFKSVNSNCRLYVPMGLEYKYWNSTYGWDDVFGTSARPIYGYTNFSVSADAKWGTYILSFDYALPEGVKAYKCNEVNSDGNLVLSDETTTIQRETPYILYAEEGCSLMEISGMYDQSSHSTIPEKVAAGKLTGALTTQTITSTSTTQYFVLQNHADEGVKFYKTKEGVNHTVKPGRCWLTLSDSDQAFYRAVERGLGFEFGTTGVSDVHQEQTADGLIYDLQGHRVTVMEPGRIYIVNGQKILKTE